jgi:poly(3-hydroxybutyrate) depolymerase
MSASAMPGRLAQHLLSWVSALLLGLMGHVGAHADVLPRLPALGLQSDSVTVSGLSSGAYMAGQFEVAYSKSLAGAAVIAGGPYGCSRGSVLTAMLNCSCPADKPFALELAGTFGGGCQTFNPDVYMVFSERATRGNHGAIDDTSFLKKHRIWLFSGGEDHVVDRKLVNAVKTYYQRMGVPDEQVHHEDIANAGHGFPSPKATLECSITRTPFLTQCHVDAAGDLLKWLYPSTPEMQIGVADEGSLKQFKQTSYGDKKTFNSLDSSGWLYVPKACEQPGASCKLHVAFHGCEQGQSFVANGHRFGTQFVKGAGYNPWAEAGHIVVLYPQVKASNKGSLTDPYQFNPKGCWDFWGYTEKYAASNSTAPNFAKQSAPQMKAVKAMIDDLLRSH